MSLNQVTGTSSALADETEEEKPKKPDRFAKMHDELLEQLSGMGLFVSTMNEQDGMVILARADPLATKIVAVARQNPAVYKALKRYLEGSVYAVLAAEIGLIANAIAANHGINPMATIAGFFKRGQSGDTDLSAVA